MSDSKTNPIILSIKTEAGEKLEATFLPHKGMALASYKCNEIEVIDQETKQAFETTRAGLGPLIGPHFYLRNPSVIPESAKNFSTSLEKKNQDPFCHGVARYAAWNAEVHEQTIRAQLTGKEMLEGVPLSVLEGQDFKMRFDVALTPRGLKLNLSVVSEADSLVGIHYYYTLGSTLGNKRARVVSHVQDNCIIEGKRGPLPPEWKLDAQHRIIFPLDKEIDCTFFPYPDPLKGEIVLETETHRLITRTKSPSQEHSWQLWHPKGASFVCIEPLSAQDPHHPNLTVSQIEIDLEIVLKSVDFLHN